MKSWSSTLFPLAILTTLAGLTFWLVQATALPTEKNDGFNRHDPDYVISGMNLRKLDKTGRLQYSLLAAETRHYPDDDSTDIDHPTFVYFHPTKPTMTMSSTTAQLSADGEMVYMHNDVRLKRNPSAKRPALNGYMDELTINTVDETAFTKSPVLFTEGGSWLKGVGMHVDNRTQNYVLESNAIGMFESRKKAKP